MSFCDPLLGDAIHKKRTVAQIIHLKVAVN